ncbi:MAG: ATP-binding protein [Bdellovibrionota bacterium]
MTEKMTILLIEDDEQHAKIIFRYLDNKAGITVIRKENLLEGCAYINDHKAVDVVLLDLSLPDSNINNTTARMTTTFAHIPVVVLSAFEDKEFAKELIHKGAQDFLCKNNLSEDLLVRSIKYAKERWQIQTHLKVNCNLNKMLHKISELGLRQRSIHKFLNAAVRLVKCALNANEVLLFEYDVTRDSFPLIAGNLSSDLKLKSSIAVENIFGEKFKVNLLSSTKKIIYSTENHKGNYIDNLFIPDIFARANLKSGIAVSIFAQDSTIPTNFLVVYFQDKHFSSKEEICFIKAASNILAAAIKRHDLELALQEKIDELSEAHIKKDEFLSVVSHEMRTPLSVIVGYVDVLKTMPPQSKEFLNALDVIYKSSQSELRLVDDILDVSKIITGSLVMKMRSISIESIINKVISSMSLASRAKRITISVDIDDSLEGMIGDGDRLQQVFWNLLSNAVKFTGKDGTIKVSVSHSDDKLLCKVEDTGRGLTKEESTKVFDRFWQNDASTTRIHSGIGLGLSICKYIVEAHGGLISCYSHGLGKGTQFKFTIPVLQAETSEQSNLDIDDKLNFRSEKPRLMPSMQLSKKNIILIEDSPDILGLLAIYLRQEGANVKTYTSAQDALQELIHEFDSFDVLISDIGLPDVDGYELIKK